MASERQIAANRRNARKSTGPSTSAGKERASGNAYRHGLRSGRVTTAIDAKEVEELARSIAGNSASSMVLECARTAAEAMLALARVRRLRMALLEQIRRFGNSIASAGSAPREIRYLRTSLRGLTPEGAVNVSRTSADRTAQSLRRLLPELRTLDAYERRAWSRREKALGAIRDISEQSGERSIFAERTQFPSP
jgi:hypothetical protein